MTRPDSVLPKGWALAKIVDTGQYINGFAFKPEHWESTGRLIIRIQNLTESGREYNRTTFAAPESVQVEPGEILVGIINVALSLRYRRGFLPKMKKRGLLMKLRSNSRGWMRRSRR